MAFQKAIEELSNGRRCIIKPRGKSMEPKIKSGQTVLLKPVDKDLEVGDIVLVKVKGSVYLHLISAIDGDRVQISNNKGYINGWTSKHKIFGLACL